MINQNSTSDESPMPDLATAKLLFLPTLIPWQAIHRLMTIATSGSCKLGRTARGTKPTEQSRFSDDIIQKKMIRREESAKLSADGIRSIDSGECCHFMILKTFVELDSMKQEHEQSTQSCSRPYTKRT